MLQFLKISQRSTNHRQTATGLSVPMSLAKWPQNWHQWLMAACLGSQLGLSLTHSSLVQVAAIVRSICSSCGVEGCGKRIPEKTHVENYFGLQLYIGPRASTAKWTDLSFTKPPPQVTYIRCEISSPRDLLKWVLVSEISPWTTDPSCGHASPLSHMAWV